MKVYFRAPTGKYPVKSKYCSGIFTRIMDPADAINSKMYVQSRYYHITFSCGSKSESKKVHKSHK
jgi:hypothetical protein